ESCALACAARSDPRRRLSRHRDDLGKPAPDLRQSPRPDRRREALSGERDSRRAAASARRQTMTARSLFRPIPPPLVLVAALVVPAFLAGCSLSRPAPVKQMFLIESAAPPVAAKTQPGTLRVRTFNVGSAFRGKAFVYRETDLKYESDFYSEFLVAPAAMLGEGTARALENAKYLRASWLLS